MYINLLVNNVKIDVVKDMRIDVVRRHKDW